MSNSCSILGDYSSTIDQLLEASISENSSKVYKQGIQAFFNFRVQASFEHLWPPPIDHIVMFIAYMKESGFAFSTAKSYMAGLSFVVNLHGWQNAPESFLVKKLLAGFKRSCRTQDIRQPITLSLLTQITSIIPHLTISSYEAHLFQSAFLIAFFALLRVSELVALERNHVQMLEDEFIVFVGCSKTDQFGNGSSIRIPKTPDSFLMFQIFQKFQSHRQCIQATHLFAHCNTKPLTQYQFSSMLYKSLKFLEVPTNSFKSHSFRIGGATYLYLKGVSEIQIKHMGRWSSSAFKSYIRPC